ncbi:MAG: class I SAM-dependent methyltransferase [Bdellovibrionaceae bacterium]|nr:class I SAM-dependent methyltransferase [Pseudobdellovibrionaceae bacterium]MBX3032877.1 class I SAM-dependent methyltransferase [Pseudobdellovibrionaceae bacterium]
MSKPANDFFTKELAQRYDERNSKLSPITDCLHFLASLVLRDLPAQARVLCAGVGTGTEILALSRSFPGWTFVALDPSSSMLETCRERLEKAGIADRCEFVQGEAGDLPREPRFDAVLSLLVGHFIRRDDRPGFLRSMTDRLRNGGVLVNAEISFDLESPAFPSMLRNWESIQSLMGATPESLATLPAQLREVLTVLPPEETENLLRQSGIPFPVRFFQSFMICGWHGKKG